MSKLIYGVWGQLKNGLENGFWMNSYQDTNKNVAENGANECRRAWTDYIFQVREKTQND